MRKLLFALTLLLALLCVSTVYAECPVAEALVGEWNLVQRFSNGSIHDLETTITLSIAADGAITSDSDSFNGKLSAATQTGTYDLNGYILALDHLAHCICTCPTADT